MDEKNGRTSFLDLLEHMKNYLTNAKKTVGNIAERQKSLTGEARENEQPAKQDADPGEDPDKT